MQAPAQRLSMAAVKSESERSEGSSQGGEVKEIIKEETVDVNNPEVMQKRGLNRI